MRSIERLALTCALGCGLFACGGAKQGATATTTAAAAPALPAIPDEPLQLLPQSAQIVGRIDVDALRASPHFPLAQRWLEHTLCVDPSASAWLIQRTSRIALASSPGEGGAHPSWVAIAYGNYEAQDAAQIAGQVFSRDGAAVPASAARGRFTAWNGPTHSFVQLSDHVLALGDNTPLFASTDVADGRAPNWEQGPSSRPNVDNNAWLHEHAVAALGPIDADLAARAENSLANLGAGELAAHLEHSTFAIGLNLTDGAKVNAEIFYPEGVKGEDTSNRLHELLDRSGFVLRLIGLPSALTHPHTASNGPHFKVDVTLSRADVDSLADKLDAFLPNCGG